jgi:hypothetical protein
MERRIYPSYRKIVAEKIGATKALRKIGFAKLIGDGARTGRLGAARSAAKSAKGKGSQPR